MLDEYWPPKRRFACGLGRRVLGHPPSFGAAGKPAS